MKFIFYSTPCAKPRMTRRDKWAQRPAVNKYWKFKENLLKEAAALRFSMPESGFHITFFLEIPKSWPLKKKLDFEGRPHQSKPDKDNLEKAFFDALCDDDSFIWDGRSSKRWSCNPRIEIEIFEKV